MAAQQAGLVNPHLLLIGFLDLPLGFQMHAEEPIGLAACADGGIEDSAVDGEGPAFELVIDLGGFRRGGDRKAG